MNIINENIYNTIGKLLHLGYEELKGVGIESYMLDTQLLLAKVLCKDRVYVITNRNERLKENEIKEFLDLLTVRKSRKPIKYILQQCEFMGINLFVKEGVLIPRPDTEILVDEVISEIKKKGFKKVCDLCSGSGAIGLAIAAELPEVLVKLYDISKAAEEVSKENIIRLDLGNRVFFYESDLLNKAIEGNEVFDVIVSNPPYIKESIISGLMEDVRNHEPYIALCGGEDGLDFYKKITLQSLNCLEEGGLLAFEIGHDQAEDVQKLLIHNGFVEVRCIKDLAGHDRVVLGVKYNLFE
jgi:release factor glutamine methyltransferase